MLKQAAGREYFLPDGEKVYIGKERFLAPEVLFDPIADLKVRNLVGKREPLPRLDDIIVQTIQSCAADLQPELFRNTVLAGGSSLFPGLQERLEKEIKEQVPASTEVSVLAPPRREISAWVGGSLLASSDGLAELLVTREEYEKKGPEVLFQ